VSDAAYAELIRDFCEAADIGSWNDVVQSKHVAMEDRLIGLIPMDGELPTLSVCIELGQTYPDRDGSVYERLLAADGEGVLV
jgi:hypothetical protein